MKRGWTMTLPRPGAPVGRVLARGGAAAPAFSPADVAGLVVWLEATGTLWQDSARTIPATAEDAPVGAWDDASGLANHVLQATSGKRPLLKLAVQNGRPVLRFDGVDDALAKVFTLNQPLTGFAVHKPVGPINKFLVDGTGGPNKGSFANTATDTMRLTASAPVISGACAWNAWHTSSWVVNGTGSQIYTDGALVASGSIGVVNMDGLTVGSAGNNAFFWNSDLAAVLFYTGVLSDTDRQSVEVYLKGKWGTP